MAFGITARIRSLMSCGRKAPLPNGVSSRKLSHISQLRCGKKDNSVMFIDATAQCVKVTNNNRLSVENIDSIVDSFTKRKDVKYFCRLVPYEDFKAQNYNLSVCTYTVWGRDHNAGVE